MLGLNIFIQINEHIKFINIQYITMVCDGIQKEAIRLQVIYSNLSPVSFWFKQYDALERQCYQSDH